MKRTLLAALPLLTLALASLASAQSSPSATLRFASVGDGVHRSPLTLEIDGQSVLSALKVDTASASFAVAPGKHQVLVVWNDGSYPSQTLSVNAVAGQLDTVLIDSIPDPVRGPAITVFAEGSPTSVGAGLLRMRAYDATPNAVNLPGLGVQGLQPGQEQTAVLGNGSSTAYRSTFVLPAVGGLGSTSLRTLTDTAPY